MNDTIRTYFRYGVLQHLQEVVNIYKPDVPVGQLKLGNRSAAAKPLSDKEWEQEVEDVKELYQAGGITESTKIAMAATFMASMGSLIFSTVARTYTLYLVGVVATVAFAITTIAIFYFSKPAMPKFTNRIETTAEYFVVRLQSQLKEALQKKYEGDDLKKRAYVLNIVNHLITSEEMFDFTKPIGPSLKKQTVKEIKNFKDDQLKTKYGTDEKTGLVYLSLIAKRNEASKQGKF